MMKIKEITNKNIWEKFISDYPPVVLFQSWNWGEAIKVQSAKCKVQSLWRLGIYDDNRLVGIAQVNKVTAKRGTFLHVRHGPIFSSLNREYFNFLFDNLKKLVKEQRASFIRISPLLEDSRENRHFFKDLGFRDAPIHRLDGEVCWVLDLGISEENLLANMRKTTRYLVKKAQKLGVEIVKTKNIEDMDDFFSLYLATAKRHHFVPHKCIKEEFEEFVKDDQILLFKGYYQKELLSVALIVFYKDQAVYHHSASTKQKIPVNYLLQWEVIKEAKRRGKAVYNLWGVAPEGESRHPWKGHSLFKKGFGGRQVEYLHAKDHPCSLLYCMTFIIETIKKVWKGY